MCGADHFSVSSHSGQYWCVHLRSFVRIGRAKGLAFSMYASTLGSLVPIISPVSFVRIRPRPAGRCCSRRYPEDAPDEADLALLEAVAGVTGLLREIVDVDGESQLSRSGGGGGGGRGFSVASPRLLPGVQGGTARPRR